MKQKQTYNFSRLTMGTCYYPEQWDESLWASDLDRMKAAGISVIRIAEFAWTMMEPTEGVFDFHFFDRFMDLCDEKDMKVILGTPSATPPVYFTETYPEILNASKDGTLYRHGGRRHYNYNSQVYQNLVKKIVGEMASHYGKRKCVIGWQIDNELNCETDEFYSASDSIAFRVFLKKKYGTLKELNRAWGTVVWNQTYTAWNEIYVLRPTLNKGINPHQHLDYLRFISESALQFAEMQADIVRRYKKPEDFITTNGLFGNLDNHTLQNEILDIYMYDSYPDFAYSLGTRPELPENLNDRRWSMKLTEVRSVCPHFGVIEQQSGACGWSTRMESPAPRPGQLALWAMQSVAQGADFISFFRWRTATFGTEIYWHGILDYDSRDNRKLAEVTAFGEMQKKLDEICGSDFCASFAVLVDYDNLFDASVDQWHGRVAWNSKEELFAAAELTHTPYNLVKLDDDTQPEELGAYPVVFYPHPVIMNEKRAAILATYVTNGGTLVIGCRSGLKDMNGHMTMLPQPGLLSALTGTDVREFTFASPAEEPVTAVWESFAGNGQEARAADKGTEWDAGHERPAQTSMPMAVFHDVLTPLAGTKVLARYNGSFYSGEAALTEHAFGIGRCLHYGASFSREASEQIFRYLGIEDPFSSLICAPADIELVGREKNGKKYYFVLNYTDKEQKIFLKRTLDELTEGISASGEQLIPAYGVRCYRMSI